MGTGKIIGAEEGHVTMDSIIQELATRFQKQKIIGSLCLLLAVSIFAGVLAGILFENFLRTGAGVGLALFLSGLIFLVSQKRFAKPEDSDVVRYLDRNYAFMEESAVLLVRPPKNVFEVWQLEKIRKSIGYNREKIRLPKRILVRALLFSGVVIVVSGVFLFTASVPEQVPGPFSGIPEPDVIRTGESGMPLVQQVRIRITPPSYTGLPERTEEPGNITVPDFSRVHWSVAAGGDADSVWIEFSDRSLGLEKDDDVFEGSMQIQNQLIYQIASANADTTLLSDYYAVSVTRDLPPRFLIDSPEEQRTTVHESRREVSLEVGIADDYSVTNAQISLTLAKGTGENVRFREREETFEHITGLGSREVRASLVLHADSLDMQPGDELYFYVTAEDNYPGGQTGRSETYFVIYADSSGTDQTPFGGIAVDLIPQYFRSQRQIIIDTESLLEDRVDISDEEFEKRSDEIGYNQALLRLRYGEYLGLEDEFGEEGGGPEPAGDGHDHGGDVDHSHEGDDHEEDLNEQGLQRSQSAAAAIVPEEMMHDHGSPEMNTLYADSPRALLKESLANMWDAERYLRTYRPEEALPYEYQALELLKSVQQANRQYVRKVGYELTPIPVDEKRLTGTYDDFGDPGTGFESAFEKTPIEKLELMIREESLQSPGDIQQAAGWVRDAEMGEPDRLYLLNRLRQIEEEGLTEDLKRDLIERLSDLQRMREYDPAPVRRPSLGSLPGDE